MPTTITPDERKALELIAAETTGCTEHLLIAQGFNLDLLGDLVRSGLAGVKAERASTAFRLLITMRGRQVMQTML